MPSCQSGAATAETLGPSLSVVTVNPQLTYPTGFLSLVLTRYVWNCASLVSILFSVIATFFKNASLAATDWSKVQVRVLSTLLVSRMLNENGRNGESVARWFARSFCTRYRLGICMLFLSGPSSPQPVSAVS